MAFDYDLMVIDHPHVGEAQENSIYELNNNKQYEGELISLEKIVLFISSKLYL